MGRWADRALAWFGAPSFKRHQELMEHDQQRGSGGPALGARFHWARSWLIQRQRQAFETQALVAGCNPWLCALLAAGLARQKKRVLLVYWEEPDAWDCALARRGMHAPALAEAGLPGGGRELFQRLARDCGGRVTVAWDRRVSYSQEAMAFLEKSPARLCGSSQSEVSGWLREAFRSQPRWGVKNKPARFGGGEREGVVFFDQAIWASDLKDGEERALEEDSNRVNRESGLAAPVERWGSAAWSTANPAAFARLSLEDTRLAARLGGWSDGAI